VVRPSQRSTSLGKSESGEASTAFDRSSFQSWGGASQSFPAFRGMLGDGRIRRSIPRSHPLIPSLHNLFCRDLSPVGPQNGLVRLYAFVARARSSTGVSP